MFWIVLSFLGLMAFAMMLGQLPVWFTVLKFALMVAPLVIAIMGILLLHRRIKAKPDSKLGHI